VRVLDPATRKPYLAGEYECKVLDTDTNNPPTLYRPSQGDLGYSGRTGIYELLSIDEQMRTLIHEGAGEQTLETHARSRGPSIRQNGASKVLDGTTTLEEVLRVSQSD